MASLSQSVLIGDSVLSMTSAREKRGKADLPNKSTSSSSYSSVSIFPVKEEEMRSNTWLSSSFPFCRPFTSKSESRSNLQNTTEKRKLTKSHNGRRPPCVENVQQTKHVIELFIAVENDLTTFLLCHSKGVCVLCLGNPKFCIRSNAEMQKDVLLRRTMHSVLLPCRKTKAAALVEGLDSCRETRNSDLYLTSRRIRTFVICTCIEEE